MRILKMVDKPKLWSNEWFGVWQFLLKIAVNSPIKGLREEVRHRLEIELDRQIPVARVLKNSFAIRTGGREYQEVFYGKNVFAHSVKRELIWLWETIHKWDTQFANYISPKLNLGVDTLTKNPDADPEVNTVDGYLIRSTLYSNQPYSDFINDINCSKRTESAQAHMRVQLSASGLTNCWSVLVRGAFLFDTGSLISTANILNAIISLYQAGYGYNDDFNSSIDIVATNPATTTALVDADFGSFGTTSFASRTLVAVSASSQYYEWSLDSNGKANINKGGISKFGMSENHDTARTPPTWGNSYNSHTYFATAEAGVSQAPKLTVTYTLPVSFIPKIMVVN